jgi:hypothetical protein
MRCCLYWKQHLVFEIKYIQALLMRSVLLQLHIRRSFDCVSWSNVPAANGVQITVYANAGVSRSVEHCARRCYSMLERSFASTGGVKAHAPCVLNDGVIYEAFTCDGVVPGLHKRVLVYIADGSDRIDPSFEAYFAKPNAVVIPLVDTSLACSTLFAEPREALMHSRAASGIQDMGRRVTIADRQFQTAIAEMGQDFPVDRSNQFGYWENMFLKGEELPNLEPFVAFGPAFEMAMFMQ